jgi:hypothetical protein
MRKVESVNTLVQVSRRLYVDNIISKLNYKGTQTMWTLVMQLWLYKRNNVSAEHSEIKRRHIWTFGTYKSHSREKGYQVNTNWTRQNTVFAGDHSELVAPMGTPPTQRNTQMWRFITKINFPALKWMQAYEIWGIPGPDNSTERRLPRGTKWGLILTSSSIETNTTGANSKCLLQYSKYWLNSPNCDMQTNL